MPSTFIDTLRTLADAETQFIEVVKSLGKLYDAGALQRSDLVVYERLRGELFAAQLTAWGVYAFQVRSYLPAEIAAQIPVPVFAPNFPRTPNFGPGVTSPEVVPARGLGFAPVVIAVGGASIAIPIFALALLALLTAAVIGAAIVAIVYTILASQELDNAALRAQQDARAEQQFYTSRLACLRSGRSVADCTALVPLPTDVRPPDTSTPPSQTWLSYAAWGAGGLAFVVLALGWMRYMGGGSGGGGGGKTPRVYVVE